MIVALVIFSIGLVTSWFALEGLRQRVHRLEQTLADRAESPVARNETQVRPEIGSAAARPSVQRPIYPVEPARTEPTTEPSESEPGLVLGIADRGQWEKTIGGSWLNKVGVAAFVIGVGFLLRYSFGDLGPRGKILGGVAIAVSMIIAGVILERKRDFPLYYGRGLVGGGWATLYFTTYAAYGIEAARVIHNPTSATALLLAVAVGMILHSLRYRSEVVTALAYFLGFVALALTPMSTFGVIASLPLAMSLLFLAYRFKWSGMALAGLVVTYSAYLFSVASLAPSSLRDQLVLSLYWLMFEAFDLFSLATKKDPREKESLLPVALFPLNACAFVGASMLRWDPTMPTYIFSQAAALLFFVDTWLRRSIAPSLRSENEPLTPGVIRGYEASLTAAVLLTTAAVIQRFSGLRLDIALLLEAEMLIVAGIQLELMFPCILGSLTMVLPISRILVVDFFSHHWSLVLGSFAISNWSLVALLAVGVLYTNRSLVKYRWNVVFGYAAALLLALVIDVEIIAKYEGLAWLTLGVALFEVGVAMRAIDLRAQGYAAGALGLLGLLVPSILADPGFSALSLAIGALVMWSVALQMYRANREVVSEMERNALRRLAMAAGNTLLAVLLWRNFPDSLVAPGWSFLALALMLIGVEWNERDLRLESYAIAILAFIRCWQTNFQLTTTHYGFSDAIVTSAMVIIVLYSMSLIRLRESAHRPEEVNGELEYALRLIDSQGSSAFACAAIILLSGLLYQRVEAKALTEAWGLEAVALLLAGFFRRDTLSRLSGLFLLGVCVLKLFLYDLSNLETLARIVSFMLSGLLLLGVSLMYARFFEILRPHLSDGPKKRRWR